MSGAKHTPGPWRAKTYADFLGVFAGDAKTPICDLGLAPAPDWPAAEAEETTANARLMAAAPDLLDALKNLRRAYVSLLQSGRDRILDLGGTCDPVDRMERDDPALRVVDGILAKVSA